MDTKSSIKKQNALVRVVCTFVFTLFAFFYLYYFQADLLTVMQHVFSKGQTHYDHFIGAVLITVVLLLIQLGVVNLFRKMRMAWAFTFVPSALCLAALTDVHSSDVGNLEFGGFAYLLPVALVAFGGIAYGLHASGIAQAVGAFKNGVVRQLWSNLLGVLCCVLFVCFCGNNDATYHVRIHAEQCLLDGDADAALKALKASGRSDENLTMLTAYALSRKNVLAEHLFEYPLKGGAHSLMPDGKGICFELLPDSTFYSRLGGWYLQRMSAMKYVDYQQRHHRMNKHVADYLLCGYLMERNLDAFVANIGKYYQVNDSADIPKHYKEALLLYTHMRSAPRIIYNNNVMNADFQDFQNLEKSIPGELERKNALRDTYGNTYWYYYQYKE